jgi:hypothetical protein
VNRAIRAYVESCPEPPAAALQARVERQARELLTEGHPPDRVITAAANAGRGGWTDLATQLQRDAATVSNAGQPGRATSKAQGWLTVDQDHPEQTAIGGQP